MTRKIQRTKLISALFYLSFLLSLIFPVSDVYATQINHLGALNQKKIQHHSNQFWYFTLENGANWRKKAPFGNGTKSYLVGPVVGGALGYQFNQYLRAEGEVVFRQTALGTITDTQLGSLTAEEASVALMLNGYFTPLTFHHIAPFIGAGLGYGLADLFRPCESNAAPIFSAST